MSHSRRAVIASSALATVGCTGIAGQRGGTETNGGGSPTGSGSDGASGGADGEAGFGSDSPPTTDVLHLGHSRSAFRSAARSGGPPKDGIPSIDNPEFEPARAVGDRLGPDDIVFGAARNGDARAYPQNILVHHEIVNDRIDGDPVSVTYCPLTGTAMGFERGDTSFGVSGRLVNNNLIMYDRATEAWWPQVAATAVPGPWNESPAPASLREFRVIWTTWKRGRTPIPRPWS
jgi:hypothetical protein